MNEQAVTYVKNRIKANKAILSTKSDKATVLMIENAITELEGVLEILEMVKSRTSVPVKFADDEK